MTAKQRFFVGVGAQKAGTTWLWDYLATHPEVGISPVKELFFFDSKYTEAHAGANRQPRRVRRDIRRILAWDEARPLRRARLLGLWAAMLAGHEPSYRRFLETVGGDRPLAGEITPSYTMLDERGLAALERTLDRPLYLLVLRNPADRFWSHVRYEARWSDDAARTPELVRLLDKPTYGLRSGYARFHRALTGIAGRGRLHLFFYEDLFDPARTQPTCDRLCDFLGIARQPGDTGRRINAGDAWADGRFDRQAVVEALAGEYRYIAGLVGEALPESWRRDLAHL